MNKIRILDIGLGLACNGGSCGEISLKRDKCDLHLKRLPYKPRLQVSFSPIARIQMWPIN